MAGRRTGQAGSGETHPPSPLGYHFFREQMSVLQPVGCGRNQVFGWAIYAPCLARLSARRCALAYLFIAFFWRLAARFWSFLAAFCARFALFGPRKIWPADGRVQDRLKQSRMSTANRFIMPLTISACLSLFFRGDNVNSLKDAILGWGFRAFSAVKKLFAAEDDGRVRRREVNAINVSAFRLNSVCLQLNPPIEFF